MMIDLNGPDIEAVDEVKEQELQIEDAVKEQCRCNPTEQECTGQK